MAGHLAPPCATLPQVLLRLHKPEGKHAAALFPGLLQEWLQKEYFPDAVEALQAALGPPTVAAAGECDGATPEPLYVTQEREKREQVKQHQLCQRRMIQVPPPSPAASRTLRPEHGGT